MGVCAVVVRVVNVSVYMHYVRVRVWVVVCVRYFMGTNFCEAYYTNPPTFEGLSYSKEHRGSKFR